VDIGLEKLAGEDCNNVISQYSQEVAKKHMVAQGYTMGDMVTKEDGTVEMVFNKYY
jgi:hypothetical protein